MASAGEAAAAPAPEQPAPEQHKEAAKQDDNACSDACQSLGLGVVLNSVGRAWSTVSHTGSLGARLPGARAAGSGARLAVAARTRRCCTFSVLHLAHRVAAARAGCHCGSAHAGGWRRPLARRGEWGRSRRTGRGRGARADGQPDGAKNLHGRTLSCCPIPPRSRRSARGVAHGCAVAHCRISRMRALLHAFPDGLVSSFPSPVAAHSRPRRRRRCQAT
jgi:hypothetical protein